MRPWRRLVRSAISVVLVLASAEAVSRIDDWIFHGVPLAANPDRHRDLVIVDVHGVHGRPHGQFRKWKLNSFGFRGAEMGREPDPTRRRVMILGASETFGLYESPGEEFPAQVAKLRPDLEIVNAAMAGMMLPSMQAYWEKWLMPFRPDTVLLYPSPQFYLEDEVPRAANPTARVGSEPAAFSSRFYPRLRDTVRQSALLRRLRVKLLVWRAHSSKGDDWSFHELPQDRVDAYVDHVESMCDAIERSGSCPIIISHANKAASPPRSEDLAAWEPMRVYFPRASSRLLAEFEVAANQALGAMAQRRQWKMIDASRHLSSHSGYFADAVHFTDAGARKLAEILAEEI